MNGTVNSCISAMPLKCNSCNRLLPVDLHFRRLNLTRIYEIIRSLLEAMVSYFSYVLRI